jgi:DNA-binding MarR family transcriptional regulator
MSDRGVPMTSDGRRVAPVRSIVAVFREFEQAARQTEMSIGQYRFMLFLRNGPRRAGEVATTSAVTKATISAQIAALKEKRWIEAKTDASDRRASRLVLTESGRAAMNAFEARLLDCLYELIGDADRERILGSLSELYVALGATRESRFTDLLPAKEGEEQKPSSRGAADE